MEMEPRMPERASWPVRGVAGAVVVAIEGGVGVEREEVVLICGSRLLRVLYFT